MNDTKIHLWKEKAEIGICLNYSTGINYVYGSDVRMTFSIRIYYKLGKLHEYSDLLYWYA